MTERRRRGRFSKEEDQRLRILVEHYGSDAWASVSAGLPGRTRRQCRERWSLYLSDAAVSAPWTPEEDAILLQQIEIVGPRWGRLAQALQNRTDLAVKRRWQEIFRGRRTMLQRDAVKCVAHRTRNEGQARQRRETEEVTVPFELADMTAWGLVLENERWSEW
jgi:myb proto-oncogene protein